MRLRALATLGALLLLSALAWAQSKSTTEAPEVAGPPPVSLTALVGQVLERFPRVEGEVVEVQGKTLTLGVGRSQAVRVGLTFAVYRQGREIRNPRTGELLGHMEEALGRATVTQVQDRLSVATFEGSDVRPADRVRTGADKVKLTLLAFKGGVKDNLLEAVSHELYDGLTATDRFDIALGDQISVWLGQEGITPEAFLRGERVSDAAAQFRTEHILAVLFKTVERKPFMEVRLFSPPRPEPAITAAFFVPPSIKAKTPGQFSASEQPRLAPERRPRSFLARLLGGDLEAGAYSSGESAIPLKEVARFAFPIVAFDMGVPKDGIPRLLISDGDKVFLYRVVNRELVAEWTYSGYRVGRVFGVYLVDLDGDGVPEIVVNRYDAKLGINAVILSIKDGAPKILVQDIHSFLVALDETGTGLKQTLWSQYYSPETFFAARKVERVTVKNGELESRGYVPVPESFRATGVTTANILGKEAHARALVYIDGYDRLRITSGPEEIWRSTSPVGDGGYLKLQHTRYVIRDGISTFFSMQPTPLAVDLDGDGVDEVVVPQNQLPGMLGVIFRGPAGVRFQQVNSGFEGVITGLGAIRGEDKEPPTLIACVVHLGGLLQVSGESQIIMTTPQ
jgi:hypothetical protein